MDTTQTEAQSVPGGVRGRSLLVGSGLLLSPLTFLFGGFVALLVLPFILPPLRRWRPFAYGLFAGVVVVRLLMFMGVNPVLSHAQSQVIARLEAALGGEVSYDVAEGDVISGRLRFENLRADLPELQGGIEIGQLTVNAGWFLLYRPEGVDVSGRGLEVRINAEEGRLERWLDARDTGATESVHFEIEEGLVEVSGGAGARLKLDRIFGEASPRGWMLGLAIREAAVTFRERTHTFAVFGGMSVGDSGDGLGVAVDLKAVEPELGGGIMRGSLQPGGDSFIRCNIDGLYLKPLWERYRKVDEYDGFCRGEVRIRGVLNELMLDFDLSVENYSYYHTTAMALDRTHAFDLPEGKLSGRVVLLGGKDVLFQDVMLVTQDATLATGERLNARGSGMVTLNGKLPELTGRLEAVVESGEVNHQITWAKEQSEALEDVTPNIVIVGEQFSQLELSWEVEVRKMTVNASPLSGTVSGALSGTFIKEDGARVGKLRAQGELTMADGKVDCLGLQGDFTGKVIFNPTAPTRYATLRGQIDGSLGDTGIDCEVTGDLSHPGFNFKGMTMSPEALGRKLYSYSPQPLTEADELERRNECARIFGAYAAGRRNPFEARNSGKVSFGFR